MHLVIFFDLKDTGRRKEYRVIESVKKAIHIISCFSSEEPVLGNAEIANKLGMHPSSTHHLVSTLCNEGVLMRDHEKKIPP